ncbi:tryptase-like [Anopheles nili]|uniref:tryptase-like n=1 Tax=Anopheles nili TaxID=185578 RepID=UPI00237A6776|nr:tryptase-like [Anopheles nili]
MRTVAILVLALYASIKQVQLQTPTADITTTKKYPFVAAVSWNRHLLGNGAIIAPQWVLTTASVCHVGDVLLYDVAVGEDDFVYRKRDIPVDQVIRHPEYDELDNNIALVKVRGTIEYKETVQPIALAASMPKEIDVTMVTYGKNVVTVTELRDLTCTLSVKCEDEFKDEDVLKMIGQEHGYCVIAKPGRKLGFWFSDDGAPLVADVSLLLTLSTLTISIGAIPRSLWPIRQECGVRNRSTDWPFHVGLYRSNGNASLYFCGGTIVSQWHVIGSAHCVQPYPREQLSVRYGVCDLTASEQTDRSRIDRVFIHPGYRAPDFTDDIALLQLMDPMPLGLTTQPICLWPAEKAEKDSDRMQIVEGSHGFSVGWGIGSDNVYTSLLQSAFVEVQPQSRCIETLGGKLFEMGAFFCATTPVCSGSGGSGFYVELEGQFYLGGITTFGTPPKGQYQCGVNTLTGLLATAKYTTWLKQHIEAFDAPSELPSRNVSQLAHLEEWSE